MYSIFRKALFIIANTWKQPKCPKTSETILTLKTYVQQRKNK